MTVLLQELPEALHLVIPHHVKHMGTKLEAQLGKVLYLACIKGHSLSRLANNDLDVHFLP